MAGERAGSVIGVVGLSVIVLAVVLGHAFSGSSSSSSSSSTTLATTTQDLPSEHPVAAEPATTSALDDKDANFIGSIRDVGISLSDNEAILQAHAVCLFVEPPNGGSILDAVQQVKQMHDEWNTVTATHFVDYSIINYCPDRAPTP